MYKEANHCLVLPGFRPIECRIVRCTKTSLFQVPNIRPGETESTLNDADSLSIDKMSDYTAHDLDIGKELA